jgi:hypothetical protein
VTKPKEGFEHGDTIRANAARERRWSKEKSVPKADSQSGPIWAATLLDPNGVARHPPFGPLQMPLPEFLKQLAEQDLSGVAMILVTIQPGPYV